LTKSKNEKAEEELLIKSYDRYKKEIGRYVTGGIIKEVRVSKMRGFGTLNFIFRNGE
jgi:hypothetical protein